MKDDARKELESLRESILAAECRLVLMRGLVDDLAARWKLDDAGRIRDLADMYEEHLQGLRKIYQAFVETAEEVAKHQ